MNVAKNKGKEESHAESSRIGLFSGIGLGSPVYKILQAPNK
jgi:hypothetical protein